MTRENFSLSELAEFAKIFNEIKNGKTTECLEKKALGKHIVVLQRGWVFTGNLFKEGEQYSLENAAVIRVWGTTKGLGEIAFNGPTKDTILDQVPTIFFHELTAVVIIKCEK